eukprot:TRINITY_DN2439_c0_g1_i1.p1 TRINITY_DN2439_c0_g1~~TRINITY_DN2439_c0_g1_i1.p1  ORF type:complete len:292 (+),score=83.50 TRINITY_DN2439_c0_g1_i1:176-1051(+)
MIRKITRERREYLYRKSLEGKERARYEKKRKIRQALAEGKPIPTELREEEEALRKEIEAEDQETTVPRPLLDDEYARAGIEDPKIFITTSRDPSSRLAQFAKELKLIFPNSQRVNRGNHVTSQLVEACRASGVTDMIIVHEHRGEPDGLIISHLPYGPTAYFGLTNCVLRHDVRDKKTVSLVYPHLVFHNFSSTLGLRVQNILKYLFPVPKDESKRVLTFANKNDYISFRHHTFEKEGAGDKAQKVKLKEIGPRFEMRLYQIKLGSLEMDDADVEWSLRPFMNSAKKKQYL